MPYNLPRFFSLSSIYVSSRSGRPSITCLKTLAKTFRHSVWLNPVPRHHWGCTRTIGLNRQIFPMFELSICGLEKAITHLTAR